VTANPFHYGTPVDADHFAGREMELRALVTRMTDGINVVLSSPRRYGKTSLLLRAEEQLHHRNAALIHVNLLRCRDEGDLAARLASAAYRVPAGRWHRAGQAVAEFVQRLRVSPTVTFGADGTPTFGFDGDLVTRDADTIIADVYGLLADEATTRPAVLVIDEFQAVTDLGEHLPGVFKALADQHGDVSLVLAGSRAHLMDRLTATSGAPLYGMAERLSLGPVSPDDMTAYLQRRSEIGGKPMAPGVAGHVIERSGPVPNDIQRLAYAAFEVTIEPTIRVADADEGMARTASHDVATYADTLQRLTVAQRKVLDALAAGEMDQLYSSRFARSVGLASGASVSRAISALADQELIVQREGVWILADPFFKAWMIQPAP
jgi:hypothetical protein